MFSEITRYFSDNIDIVHTNIFRTRSGNDAGLNSRLYTHSENIADFKKKRQFWSKT